MTWNPSKEVAAARDFSNKFNFNKVFIIGVNETTGQFMTVSYGKNKKQCAEATKTIDKIYDQILDGTISLD